jgi:hypothetical protein
MTLVELLVAMPLGLLVLGLVLALVVSTTNTESAGVAVGQANGTVNNAMNTIKQDVINADVIFDPATEGVRAGATIKAGFSLRMLTVIGGQTTCVQWRVSTKALQNRSWPVGIPPSAVSWVTRFRGVANQQTDPPFTMTKTSPYGDRLVDVNLAITTSTPTRPLASVVQSAFSASNAQFFRASATQFCTPTPSP